MSRFKIDVRPGMPYPIGLFRRRTHLTFFGREEAWWQEVSIFDTIAEARAHYEQIKDLPEYLP